MRYLSEYQKKIAMKKFSKKTKWVWIDHIIGHEELVKLIIEGINKGKTTEENHGYCLELMIIDKQIMED